MITQPPPEEETLLKTEPLSEPLPPPPEEIQQEQSEEKSEVSQELPEPAAEELPNPITSEEIDIVMAAMDDAISENNDESNHHEMNGVATDDIGKYLCISSYKFKRIAT